MPPSAKIELQASPALIARAKAVRGRLDALEAAEAWTWPQEARPKQLAPGGDWFVWLIMAGPGGGKTRTGAEGMAQEAHRHPREDFAVVARTTQECREVCLEGQSGLLRVLGLQIDSHAYNRTTGQISLPKDRKSTRLNS